MMISNFNRRSFISAMIAFAGVYAIPAQAESPQKIADHFASVRTMAGEFIQLGPKGEETGGKFFIERPGKIRFNYEAPSNIRVVADGKSVVVNNKKLDTWDIYPLSKTPLKLLLDERIDLSGSTVKSIKEDPDLTTIVMGNDSIFGNSKITLLFDPNNYELRQWTITDAQGKDTTVMIFNVQQDVKLDPKLFKIDYLSIQQKKSAKGG
jgi:outer membrane lipoprotein-sorting protein